MPCGLTDYFSEVYLIRLLWFTNIHLIWGLSQSEKHISYVGEPARRTAMSAALHQ